MRSSGGGSVICKVEHKSEVGGIPPFESGYR